MNKKIYVSAMICCMQFLYAPVYFNGVVEGSDINKNTFHCPAQGNDCQDQGALAIGYDVSGGRTLQLPNNQEYWLQQEAAQAQYISMGRNYTGSALQAQLADEGWGVIGGFALIISSNPILVQSVMPSVQPAAGQTKVVVQLWYNGSGLIQLWSQDAQVYNNGQKFQVLLSSAQDDRLPTLMTQAAASTDWQDNFLLAVGIQGNNRQAKDYDAAHGSPRQARLSQPGSSLTTTKLPVQAPAIKMVKTAVPVVQPKAVPVAEPKKKAVAAPVVATKQTKQKAKKGKKS